MVFAPTDYNGLYLWLKADALALNDNDAVSSWTDSSGRDNHAVQATGAAQPTYKTGIANSQPAVLFDGTGDGLATSAIDLTSADAATVFVVVQPVTLPTLNNTQVILESSADATTTTNVGAVRVNLQGPDHAYTVLGQNGSGSSQYELWGTRAAVSTPAIIELQHCQGRYRGQMAGAVNANWTGEYLFDVKRGAGTRTMGNFAWNIGARNNAASLFWAGYIFEVIGYRKALNYERMAAVRSYLATKYGITLTTVDAVWVLDGYSHTDGDANGTAPNRRWWNRALNNVTENVQFHLAARAGTTVDKFADDMAGSQRFLEWSAAGVEKLLTTDGPNNDLYYSYGTTVAQANMAAEMARLAASTADYKAVTNIMDNAGGSKPGSFDADAATLNTWLDNASNRPGVDLIDYEGETPFALAAGVNAAVTTWYDADAIHVNGTNGMVRQSRALWLPWLVSKGFTQFAPSQIGGLTLWLDATQLSLNDSDLVSSWTDMSGNARHAAQADSAKQPTYKTNVLGYAGARDRPGILFNGSDEFLATPSIDLSGTQAITAFIVWQTGAASAAIKMLIEHTTSSGTQAGGWGFYRNTGVSGAFVAQGHNGTASASLTTAALSADAYRLSGAIIDFSQGAAAEIIARMQGTSYQNNSGANGTGSFASAVTYIGARAGTSLFTDGYIGEIIVYNSRLSLTNYRRVEAYLRDKWAVY